ncbi:hypothetical protein POTOM_043407 [Populus tomentosa]|uniref:GB1/RHD3-type G domain-containing protein n=1 Tax=Populus tomentosa TaxID=118781 RepID=A0A8X7YQG0_POPTO|nr:hypothetical protein POTOM_043407 [Populus tomentosa]
MEQGMQLIDGNGKFNVDGLKDFMTATEFAQSGLSYAIVAIIGSQSSGKSTLMNQTFHTNFEEMDANNGRRQTTKGIWIAKCSDIDPFTIGDVIPKELRYGLVVPTPLEYLKTALLEDIEKIWAAVAEPETLCSAPLREFFNVEITALPHYEFQEEKFKEQVSQERFGGSDRLCLVSENTSSIHVVNVEVNSGVAQLRQRFVHSIYPGGLVGDREEVEPASGFPLRAEEVMVATVRCEEIAGEKLKCFTFDEDWLKMKKTVQDCPVSGFGGAVSSILETYLSEYDREVVYFDPEVRNAKRRLLLSNALMVVRDAYDTMLMHLYSNTVNRFKTSLEQSQNEGQQYVAAIHFYSQSCMREFDQGCEGI